ncbi:MAG TPA: CPBP family intramembrane glutamate endopeptidase, partial [Bradyrhizobium sp.]|nr:CPBP family intramembrane glutamate endopeptidase [Bradyrhizobium sp.]
MDSLNPEVLATSAPATSILRVPRIWKFWGTAVWGLIVFGAMFVGQMAVLAWLLLRRDGPIDMGAAIHLVGGGLTISLSVITGVPAVLAALWIAIRITRTSFADYLALRGTSWVNFIIGAIALAVLVMAWDGLSRAMGREVTPGF